MILTYPRQNLYLSPIIPNAQGNNESCATGIQVTLYHLGKSEHLSRLPDILTEEILCHKAAKYQNGMATGAPESIAQNVLSQLKLKG